MTLADEAGEGLAEADLEAEAEEDLEEAADLADALAEEEVSAGAKAVMEKDERENSVQDIRDMERVAEKAEEVLVEEAEDLAEAAREEEALVEEEGHLAAADADEGIKFS